MVPLSHFQKLSEAVARSDLRSAGIRQQPTVTNRYASSGFGCDYPQVGILELRHAPENVSLASMPHIRGPGLLRRTHQRERHREW